MDHNRLQEIENLKQRAIQSDDVDAQIALARKYALGLTVEKDLNEAGYWYYLARRTRHFSIEDPFAKEPECEKAWKELSCIRHLVESEPLIIHGDTLIRCHSKEQSVTIPAGVKIIGHHAFSWEHKVEEVILPAGVVEIQDFAIDHKVMRVVIPFGVKKLGRGAFSSDDIEEIVLPEGILEIPNCAFGSGLRSITIPSSVTKIGNEAFDLCTKLRTINFQGSKEQWKAIKIGKYNTILRFAKKNYNYSYRGLIGQKVKEDTVPQVENCKESINTNDNTLDKGYMTIHLKKVDNSYHLSTNLMPADDESAFFVDYEDGTIFIDWKDGSPREIIGYYEQKAQPVEGAKVYDSTRERVIGRVGDELICFRKREKDISAGRYSDEEKCLAYYTENGGITALRALPYVGSFHGSEIGGAAAFVAVFFACNFKSIYRDYFEMENDEFEKKHSDYPPFGW